MQLSLLNTIFREPFMLDPISAAANRQVLVGLLHGLEFTQEDSQYVKSIGYAENATIPAGKLINVVSLLGTMLRDDMGCGHVGTKTLANMLLEADNNDKVIGHILVVDSGGGASNSVPDLADAITACKKPIIAYVDGYMCSAAMYAASYCDYIISHRANDRIGCIGTLIQIEDYPKQAKNEDGLVHLRIYADGSDEKNEEFEAALEGNFTLIKERMLNPLNEQFKDAMRRNRKCKEEQLKGRTYFASEVVETLIDEIGDFNAAIKKVIDLSNTNITKMEGFPNLQSIEGCADLQMVDETVTLQREQLDCIESALETGKEIEALRAEIATAKSDMEQVKEQNAASETAIQAKNQEIEQLKATIEELNSRPNSTATPGHNGNPINEDVDNNDPEEFCSNILKKLR